MLIKQIIQRQFATISTTNQQLDRLLRQVSCNNTHDNEKRASSLWLLLIGQQPALLRLLPQINAGKSSLKTLLLLLISLVVN